MTEDTQPGHLEEPFVKTPAPKTIMLWVALACLVVVIVALGLASHRSGVPTVTPGVKTPSASQTALNTLSERLQALPMVHRKAATRQADASG
jgi:hypothetical protein